MVGLAINVAVLVCLYTNSGTPFIYPKHLQTLPYQDVVVQGKHHRIYWTLDDHPNWSTRKALRILKKHRIRATFFVVTAQIRAYYRYPLYKSTKRMFNLLKQIDKEGHTIGNHSITHPKMCALSEKEMRKELHVSQVLIRKTTGSTPTVWRPPHGIICRKLRKVARSLRLTTVMWNISDYRMKSVDIWRRLYWRIRNNKHYSVILFHHRTEKLQWVLNKLNSYTTR